MRLWHKDLIPVLPNKQLLGQWRELSAIAGAIIKNGTPNHLLVNKVLLFTQWQWDSYCQLVVDEMLNRGFKPTVSVADKLRDARPDRCIIEVDFHTDRYLKQCLYNLQEKYDCGGISEEEWIKIKNKFIEYDL